MAEIQKKKKKKKKKKKSKIPTTIIASSVVVVIVIAYFVLSPRSVVNYVLFHPKKADSYPSIPKDLLGSKGEDVYIKASTGKKLHGIYFKMPGAKYSVILHHGQGGNIGEHLGLVKTVLLNGQSVLTYDYEGYGISSGEPSIEGILEDGKSVYDFLVRRKGVKPESIIQYGASMGSGVASNVALTRSSAGLALICPYTSLKKLAQQKFPYLSLYPDFMFPQPDIGSLTFVKINRAIPVMIVHGDKDKTIDVSHSEELKAKGGPKTTLIVEAGKHHGDFETNRLAKLFGMFLEQIDGQTYETKQLED